MKKKLLIIFIILLVPIYKVNATYTSEQNISDLITNVNNLKNNIFLKNHPIGSIYITTSTDENTTAKMASKYGGTWAVYGNGRVLKSSTGAAGQTGGSNTVTLETTNLPSHNHSYTPSGTINSTFKGTKTLTEDNNVSLGVSSYSISASNTSITGNIVMHSASDKTNIHLVSGIISSAYTNSNNYGKKGNGVSGAQSIGVLNFDLTHTHGVSGTVTLNNTTHTHSITPQGTINSTFTGTQKETGSQGNATAFSVENAYINTYIYKRTG